MGGGLGMVLKAGIYGAARPFIASLARPLTDKLPFGALNDEVGLGGAAFLLKGQRGLVGEAARTALLVEAASVGAQITTGTAMTGAPAGGLRPSVG